MIESDQAARTENECSCKVGEEASWRPYRTGETGSAQPDRAGQGRAGPFLFVFLLAVHTLLVILLGKFS